MKKIFAYVGNWSFERNSAKEKGISIFDYDSTSGDLQLIKTIDPDVAAGQLCVDAEHQILYSNDECGDLRGKVGGGGYIIAYQINPETGELAKIHQRESLSSNPSYLYRDKSGQFLLVCHCANTSYVTKIVRHEDGSFGNEVLFDDASLVLFRLNADGSPGDVCDVAVLPSAGPNEPYAARHINPASGHVQFVRTLSRLHSITASPSGRTIAVCDKGMDRIHTFRIDKENGRLLYLSTWQAPEAACFPRYSAFHPNGKWFYANNENLAVLNTFTYDEETGVLTRIAKTPLPEKDVKPIEDTPVGAQDILLHPNGKVLYCTLTGYNQIVACQLDKSGIPTVFQHISCRGRFPRGLAISPDHHYLFSGNMISGDITVFGIDESGNLIDTGKTVPAVSPSTIRFFESITE